MYKHFLIATDGSELAEKAVTNGLLLAKKSGAQVTIMTVTETVAQAPGDIGVAIGLAFPSEEHHRVAAARAKAILEKAAAAATSSGVSCEAVHVADRLPAEAIIEVANVRGCDIIIMASHGRSGLSRLILGSQTNEVLLRTTLPVLVIR